MSRPTRRGTTNRDERGSTYDRAARKQWLLDTFGDGTSAPCLIKFDDNCLDTVTMDTLSVDRFPVPGAKGGTYTRGNIRPGCGPCNSRQGGALGAARRAAATLGAPRVRA